MVRRVDAATKLFPFLLALVALGCDAVDRAVPFTILGSGLLDEPAHAATAALGLLVLSRAVPLPPRFVIAALIASIAIDLDHIPLYLGIHSVAAAPNGRPFTHSLLTVLVVLVSACLLARWRIALLGVATGLLLHLVRDVAEGPPGVVLLWPVNGHAWIGGRIAFVGLVVGLLTLGVGLPRYGRGTGNREMKQGARAPRA